MKIYYSYFSILCISFLLFSSCDSSEGDVTSQENNFLNENDENNTTGGSTSSGSSGRSGGSNRSSRRRSESNFISVCDRTEEIQKHLMCILIQDEIVSIAEKETCTDPTDISANFLSTHCATVTRNNLSQIEELRITQNVQEISANDFAHLSNLKFLFLVNIDLDELPANTFYELSNLILLDLSDNELTDLKSEAFFGLNNLEELELSENDISNLPEDVFLNLHRIKEIYLNDNDLSSPINDFYSNLNNLEVLDLSDNDDLTEEDIEHIESAFSEDVEIIN